MLCPVTALVLTKQIPLSLLHFQTSPISTFTSKSLFAPKSMYLALGTLLTAMSYHTVLILYQLRALLTSKTRTTPSHDLKYVATIDLNFYWPAVSQMQRITDRSWRSTFLYLKSMVVTSWSSGASFLMYLQNTDVLPAPESPTRIILYLRSVWYSLYNDIFVVAFYFLSNCIISITIGREANIF